MKAEHTVASYNGRDFTSEIATVVLYGKTFFSAHFYFYLKFCSITFKETSV
jgi:hypothetical protein